jgi:uncharacterized protein (TIGR00255 family)
MIRSMTAFASVNENHEWGQLSWELRTVNHRYLELSFRLPDEFRVLELRLREHLNARLARGKVDVNLKVRNITTKSTGLSLNESLADEVAKLAQMVKQRVPHLDAGNQLDFLMWPGMVLMPESDSAAQHEAAFSLFEQAVTELLASREREGSKLHGFLMDRLARIETLCQQITAWLPDIQLVFRNKLESKLIDLKQAVDPNRLEQELVLYLQKMDVSEELDRLTAHIAEARRLLNKEQSVGRRLDFLLQEFNRESNTLGSKSVDQRTSHASVELKVLIEQLREQVQNLE